MTKPEDIDMSQVKDGRQFDGTASKPHDVSVTVNFFDETDQQIDLPPQPTLRAAAIAAVEAVGDKDYSSIVITIDPV